MKSLVFLFLSLTTLVQGKSKKFDVLILTQHWPYTTCMDWQEESHQTCRHIDHSRWTVHGLWPTQFGRIGPGFCNKSWPFEHKVLEPIMDDMQLYWPDVEVRDVPDSLWAHEWSKHGTCAAQLPETSSEVAYFNKGCELAKENPITEWLTVAGIVPQDSNTHILEKVWDAVMNGTGGFRPHVDCIRIENKAYLSEIKVCYSKNFTRVNCDGIKAIGGSSGDMMGKCLRYDSFIYPATARIPSHSSSSGLIGGIVCSVLAVCAAGLGVGYMIYKKQRRVRGYESL